MERFDSILFVYIAKGFAQWYKSLLDEAVIANQHQGPELLVL